MKESGKMRLKSTIYESTLSTADAVPLPRWGRQISSGYAANIYGAMPESLSISGFPFWTFQTLPTWPRITKISRLRSKWRCERATSQPNSLLRLISKHHIISTNFHNGFKETLIKSQNQISYGFLYIASSTFSLNSSLFASNVSSLCIKNQEWNLITI